MEPADRFGKIKSRATRTLADGFKAFIGTEYQPEELRRTRLHPMGQSLMTYSSQLLLGRGHHCRLFNCF